VISKPHVSIVTPCLNPGDWLSLCLDSVTAQTYPQIEHLVIDGGSTDGTVELLTERGVRFVSEPDRGQTHAINKGFALARGDWLGWLNADDRLTPNAIELAVAAIEAKPGAGWVYGDCDMRRNGKPYLVATPPEPVTAEALAQGWNVPQPGSLVARWALERIGFLDERFDLAMDFDLWLRLIDAGVPSVYVRETLSVFELHEGSKSGSVPESEFGLEVAVAQLKRGQRRWAAFSLGTAAASAAREGDRIPRQRLETELRRVVTHARGYTPDIDVATVRASAYAEAATFELFKRPRGFRHLLRPEPWLVYETRTRLAATLARGVGSQLLRRIAR
jgi:cellulose synthase/poly-beta-1,6-N-acetylglucosamine synthase-like glycosyltransferase